MNNAEQKRVLDTSKVALKPRVDPLCHRTMTPMLVPEQVAALNPQSRQMEPAVNMVPKLANFTCMRERCVLFNQEAGECYDVTAAKAQAKTAEMLVTLDGLLRIGTPAAGSSA